MAKINKEENSLEVSDKIIKILLFDHSSNKNIIWATNNYLNKKINFDDQISLSHIKSNLIKPRCYKTLSEQILRAREKGEVFTPTWVCNHQNNLVDIKWFKNKVLFNFEKNDKWVASKDKIKFPKGKTWVDYIKDVRLEICCGEAPYIVSRYDSLTGEYIPLENRIGILDRKFRILNENASSNKEWIEKSFEILKAIYGFEWQGDNLFLARKNVLFSFIDYYVNKFDGTPSEELLISAAEIISWNLWQMDGLKFVIPNSCHKTKDIEIDLFGEREIEIGCPGCMTNNSKLHNGTYCIIMNWKTKKRERFIF